MRHETKKKRAQVEILVGFVNLGEPIVVERECRVGRDELPGVVSEWSARIAILNEVAARSCEREPSDESRGFGDTVHAIAGLGREGECDFARSQLRANEP